MSLDSREFRDALGCFATGVCVITANPEGWEPFGMTVNSFASVSLDPPLVLWSLQNNSEVFDHFSAAPRYAINVLCHEQEGLSSQYARRGDHRLDAEHCLPDRDGSPLLRGALVSFDCELAETHPGGDHVIIVGRVIDVVSREDGEPLLFYGGAYRGLR